MWALVESNSITRFYTRPTAITVGDVNYPANIMSMWTASELEAIGIYEVVNDNTNHKDGMYYKNGEETFTFASGVVTRSYGVATARQLNDTLWTAEDIKPIGVSTGDTKEGLKSGHKWALKSTAGSNLGPFDWYTIRAADGGTAIPSAIATYRTAVRTACHSMEAKIDAATTVDELAALYVYNNDDPPTKPLGEWPDLPTL